MYKALNQTLKGIKKNTRALYLRVLGKHWAHQIILLWVIVWQMTEDTCRGGLWKYQGMRDHFQFDGQTKLSGRNKLNKAWGKSEEHNDGAYSSCKWAKGQEFMAILRDHRCVMERRQEKGLASHFQCDKSHSQEVGLYSGKMGNCDSSWHSNRGNDMLRVKFS